MPYESVWRAPQRLLRYRGVTIYHSYMDDELNSGPSHHYFVTDKHEGSDMAFDVRELKTWSEPPHPPFIDTQKHRGKVRAKLEAAWKKYHDDHVEEQHVKAAIKAAIASGEIKPGH